MLTRREFLKVGLVGAAGLAAVSAFHYGRQKLQRAPGGGLDAGERAIIVAITPVLLSGALPEEAGGAAVLDKTVAGVERAIAGLSAGAQEEVKQLFALLGFAPTRIMLAGLTDPWPRASAAAVERFLERWRFSRFGLLRAAYAALHDLVLGTWYADQDSWNAIGYPGPPEVI